MVQKIWQFVAGYSIHIDDAMTAMDNYFTSENRAYMLQSVMEVDQTPGADVSMQIPDLDQGVSPCVTGKLVLVVDEIDKLLEDNRYGDLVHNLFAWTNYANSNLSVVMLSNDTNIDKNKLISNRKIEKLWLPRY